MRDAMAEAGVRFNDLVHRRVVDEIPNAESSSRRVGARPWTTHRNSRSPSSTS